MNHTPPLSRRIALAIALLAGLSGTHRATAAILINPDGTFDNPAPFTQASEVTWQDRYPDATVNSWFTRNEGHTWSNYGGYASVGGTNGFQKLGQVFAVPLAASNETALQFSFDWKPGSGSTGNQLQIAYWLIGWKTNSAPSASDLFWDFIPWNSYANNYGVSNLNGHATAYDLTGAFTNFGEANFYTGTAGQSNHYTGTFDLPVPTLADLDFVGIRISSRGPPVQGHYLDNVMLVAVPEPSSVALIGVGALLVGWAGRRNPAA